MNREIMIILNIFFLIMNSSFVMYNYYKKNYKYALFNAFTVGFILCVLLDAFEKSL